MKITITTCDNCGVQFDPQFGVGELKMTFTNPNNPIIVGTGTKMVQPNVQKIRKNELCPICALRIMEIIKQSLKSES